MAEASPTGWRTVLAEEREAVSGNCRSSSRRSAASTRCIRLRATFNALRLTPIHNVKVLLLGQDPYHGPGQAHGLCFSVRPGVPVPPSLQNMYKELHDDVGFTIPKHGYLAHWAEQGVLLLNAVLTVRAGQANSHKGHGWETFTDAVIRAVNAQPERVVFLLWGAYARQKRAQIDTRRHLVLECHPSPPGAQLFLRLPAFLEDQRGAGGGGARRDRLAAPETVA
jgi:uracil-DNA glycosylase